MSELIWESYFNDIAKVQGRQAKTRNLIFKVLPNQGLIDLRIQKAYCGEIIKIYSFEEVSQAIGTAEHINNEINAGRTIDEIFKS